jgi:hypothetical protein
MLSSEHNWTDTKDDFMLGTLKWLFGRTIPSKEKQDLDREVSYRRITRLLLNGRNFVTRKQIDSLREKISKWEF